MTPMDVTSQVDATAELDPGSTVVEVHALGARLHVDLGGTPARFAERFRHVWHLCLPQPRDGALVDAGRVVARDVVDVVSRDDPARDDEIARGLMLLTQHITTSLIKARAGQALMFHAGALADLRSGAAFVYVAQGGTGKTTLTRALGSGLAYLTDETVAVGVDGWIDPYPKPLSVRREPFEGIKDETAPGDLGLRPPVGQPWVAGMVVLERDPAVRRPEVTRLGVLDAITALAPETSSLARLPKPLHLLADLLTASGGLRRVRYGEAADLRDLLHDVTGRTQ